MEEIKIDESKFESMFDECKETAQKMAFIMNKEINFLLKPKDKKINFGELLFYLMNVNSMVISAQILATRNLMIANNLVSNDEKNSIHLEILNQTVELTKLFISQNLEHEKKHTVQ